MSTVYLVTYHMTVVCKRDDAILVNVPLRQIDANTNPVECHLNGLGELSFNSVARKSLFSPDYYRVKPGRGGRTVFLERAGRYLRAFPSGQVDCHAFEAAGWEEFLLLSPDQYASLLYFVNNVWVDLTDGTAVDPDEIVLGREFSVTFGAQSSSYRNFDAAVLDDDRSKVTFYYNEWKVKHLHVVRPLVYYVAFGSKKYVEMSFISMESWKYFNRTQTSFLVITDLSAEQVVDMAPPSIKERILVWTMAADEFFDYAMQRFRIAEWPHAEEFWPLIYLDTDVVCDAPLDETIVEVVLSNSIMVANEPWSSQKTSESVGSTLIVQDECCFAKELGFNSGTIAIPDARKHRSELRAIAEVMYRYASSTPGSRMALHWFDQSCANYVSAKIGNFDGETLGDIMTFVGHGQDVTEGPRGLVHFWGGHDKASVMSKYLVEQRGVPLSQLE